MPPMAAGPGPPFADERRLRRRRSPCWRAGPRPARPRASSPPRRRRRRLQTGGAWASPTWWSRRRSRCRRRRHLPQLRAAGRWARCARRWVRAVEIVPGDARARAPATHLRTRPTRRAGSTPPMTRLASTACAPSRGRALPTGTWWAGRRAVSRGGAPDLAWELAAGTDLVLELHLLPLGRTEIAARASVSTSRAGRRRAVHCAAARSQDHRHRRGRGRVSRRGSLRPACGGRRARGLSARALSVPTMRATATLPTDNGRRCSTSRPGTSTGRTSTGIAIRSGCRRAPSCAWSTSSTTRRPIRATRTSRRGASSMGRARATRWVTSGCRWCRATPGRRSPRAGARAPRERVEHRGLARRAGAHARRRDAPSTRQRAGAHRRARRGNRRARARGRARSGARRAHTNLGNAFVARRSTRRGERVARISSARPRTSSARRRSPPPRRPTRSSIWPTR